MDHRQRRYDEKFLRNANKAAANAAGEKSWTNATWVVNTKTSKFLRAEEAKVGTANESVALVGGKPVAVNPLDAKAAVVGDLDVAAKINGIPVTSNFRLLKEAAAVKSLADTPKLPDWEQLRLRPWPGSSPITGKRRASTFTAVPSKRLMLLYRPSDYHLELPHRQCGPCGRIHERRRCLGRHRRQAG